MDFKYKNSIHTLKVRGVIPHDEIRQVFEISLKINQGMKAYSLFP